MLKGLYNSFKMETQQSVARDAGCSQSAVSKTWYRQNGKITKGRSQSIWTENSKQYVLKMENCTTKEMKSKWSETGDSACDKNSANNRRKKGFSGLKRNSH